METDKVGVQTWKKDILQLEWLGILTMGKPRLRKR
jgi:hypothetical protein